MRWTALFADLEAELDALETAELAAEVADRSRWEVGRVHVLDRLRAAVGGAVTVGLAGGPTLTGTVDSVGVDWVLLSVPQQPDALLPLSAVLWFRSLPVAAVTADDAGRVASRLDLRYLLRVICRDRAPVSVLLADGAPMTGTIDRVGADFIDVAEHLLDEVRRSGTSATTRTIPVSAVVAVRPR